MKRKDKHYWFRNRTKDEIQDGNILKFHSFFQKSIYSGTWLENSKLYLENNFDYNQAATLLNVNLKILLARFISSQKYFPILLHLILKKNWW